MMIINKTKIMLGLNPTYKLKEYMIKGFALNDELLKQSGGGRYWKELLERIRDIKS